MDNNTTNTVNVTIDNATVQGNTGDGIFVGAVSKKLNNVPTVFPRITNNKVNNNGVRGIRLDNIGVGNPTLFDIIVEWNDVTNNTFAGLEAVNDGADSIFTMLLQNNISNSTPAGYNLINMNGGTFNATPADLEGSNVGSVQRTGF